MKNAAQVAFGILLLAAISTRCAPENASAPARDGGTDGSAGSGGSSGSGADAEADASTSGVVPRPPYAYPSDDPDVCFVPVADKLQLQKVLDDEGGVCPSHKLRLEGGDYASGGLSELVVRSGYEIYGLPGTGEHGVLPTSVPPIRVAGGTERAVLSTLRTSIDFEPSELPTRHNLIRRIEYGTVRAGSGVRLESNLFLGLSFTNIDIDTSSAGYARFNRFIYTRVQTNLLTHLRLVGDANKQSRGNTILWFQSLGAGQSGLFIADQGDLTLLDVGGEVWASGKDGVLTDDDKRSALVRAESTPGSAPSRLWALNLNGGNILGWPTGLADIAVDQFVVMGLNETGPLGSPRTVLREQNRRFVALHQSMGDVVSGAPNADPWSAGAKQPSVIFDESSERELRVVESHVESPERRLFVNDVASSAALPPAQQQLIRETIAPGDRAGEPWERPSFDPIPDPAGPDWNVGLADKLDPNGQSDSTPFIQSLIDSTQIGYLPAGTWYITEPLKFRSGRGLRGAGMGKTVIVAKTPDFDMVVNDDQISYPGTFQDGVDVAYATGVALYLLDLSLQGGKNGIHHSKETAGDLAQLTSMMLSHVQFRHMAESGIFIDRVYAWDTNLLDRLVFFDCKQSAIKQRVEQHTGEAPGLAYMDKNFFYESQFIGSAIALDQHGGRASGGNVYAFSLFRDNGVVAQQVAHSADLFANSDFVDNGGDESMPMISNNGWVDLVSCHVSADKAKVLLRGLFDIEGTTFRKGSAESVKLMSDAVPHGFLYATNSSFDFPVGSAVAQGVLSNVVFAADDPLFSEHTHFVAGGVVSTLVSGPSSPAPQLLVGSRF